MSVRTGARAVLAAVLLVALGFAGRDGLASDPGSLYSITSPDTAGRVGHYPSLDLDALGNPVVSYHDDTNSDLKVLHCGDPTCTTGNNVASPDTAGFVGRYSSLVLDASGNPVVSYRFANGSTQELRVLHCGDPDCSSGNSITAPETGIYVEGTSIALDAAGNPVVAYHDASNGEVKILHCGDPDCTSGNSITAPDTSGSAGFDPTLVLDALGNPVVAYRGSTGLLGYGLRVLRCGDPNCASGNSVVVVEPGIAVNPSLVIDTAGNPVIAFVGSVNFQSQLRLLHCGDANCTNGNTINAVVQESISHPSLALDSFGYPTIAYLVSPYLRLATCGEPACGTVDRVVWVDTAGTFASGGSVGLWPSLEFDASGNPVIGYFADITDDLKVLHCGQLDCWSDQDKDRCPDEREQQLDMGTETSGGRRDHLNQHDYFNPSQDGQNRVDDILLVVQAYFKDDNDGNPGLPPYEPGYSSDYDRTLVGPDAWDLGPPNGLQRVDDILNIVKQYFHDCS